ncbi:fluoride efflux transporter CrcB [Anaerobacillus sp. CMMVII]|uniref:fluoride efflux transporter CrcB n=1 Tax=Anaerobacillus sp. CMMVII TaxID=2755588 RepID=UPI0021B74AD2|nr:fluoride efflux transporter CrcB [Anaerobacillus sp. CMMVII]MCT8138785.1 fluoride efflux transporter CrcB [Anaerobacillus sp. CMMVII]
MNLVFVMAGGAIGAMTRYGVGLYIMRKVPQPPFPLAMLVVNVIGSLGLGIFIGTNYAELEVTVLYEAPLYLFVGLGFFGAFTTFSTFSVETMLLLRQGKVIVAFIYVLLSMALSIIFFSGAILLLTSNYFGGY